MDLNGNFANTGIPTKFAIPAGAVVAFGGYHFVKQWRAGKAAATAPSAPTSTGSMASMPYGPNNGDPGINMTTTNSGFGEGQYAALGATANGVVAQNQAIMASLATSVDQEVTTNKALASLLSVNPGALQTFKNLPANSVYEEELGKRMTASIGSIYPGPTSRVPGGV